MKSNSELIHEINDVVQSIKNSERERENYMTLADRLDEKFEEGIDMGKRQVAIALLNFLDDEAISQTTKLSLEEVKILRKENAKL